MGYIFVDKENDGGNSKQQMRRAMRTQMRGGNYRSGGGNYRDDEMYREGYRQGYREGWEDSEDDMTDEHYRRQRDSRGRFM